MSTSKTMTDEPTAQDKDSLATFLSAIEGKTNAAPHLRILKAARDAHPTAAMNAELATIADEIINEA